MNTCVRAGQRSKMPLYSLLYHKFNILNIWGNHIIVFNSFGYAHCSPIGKRDHDINYASWLNKALENCPAKPTGPNDQRIANWKCKKPVWEWQKLICWYEYVLQTTKWILTHLLCKMSNMECTGSKPSKSHWRSYFCPVHLSGSHILEYRPCGPSACSPSCQRMACPPPSNMVHVWHFCTKVPCYKVHQETLSGLAGTLFIELKIEDWRLPRDPVFRSWTEIH